MENSKLKRVLILAGFIILILAIGYAIYYLFFKPAKQPTYPYYRPPTAGLPGQLPGVANENVNRQISEEAAAKLPSIERVPKGAAISDKARGGFTKVFKKLQTGLFPRVSKDGGLVYFDSAQGRFYKINPDGTVTLLSNQKFFSVSGVTWSNDANKAVLEYPDGSNIVYDFKNNKQYTLPKEMETFDFSGNDQLLGAQVITDNTDTNWLVTSNSDGSNLQFVERIGDQAKNVDVNFSPNNQVVALFRENVSANNQQVLFIGQHHENFKSLITNGRGFEGQWTPDGSKLLYSVYQADNDFKPTLFVSNASGDNIGGSNMSLGLQTWVNKCAVSAGNQFAYCAVPQNLPLGSGWYPQLADNLPDTFYKIDLLSGLVSLLAEPVGSQPFYSASGIFLSPDEKILYFQDRSGSVYSIGLP
jgi:sugar lactone lactonase YvrE